ncbi:MAG: hypothetical protein GVY30_09265 [Chloroflexi bacterium]|jgi:hypothetical protein|nr:hypothetical protein [Chloroflexota bacterium]
MDAKEMDIQPSTEEYTTFMRGVIWEEYPELTGDDSEFIENQEELDSVFKYAWEHSGYKNLYSGYQEPSVEEATLPSGFEQQVSGLQSLSSGRSLAIEYAYEWSEAGTSDQHNPDYPDFGLDDCTNFVSQAMKAGGFVEVGSGDNCKHEDTSTEWYVDPNPSPPITYLGDFRDWEWSTGWSVPWPFRDYFAFQNDYAIAHGWTTSTVTAKYYLSPGDVVQLQFEEETDVWTSYHTMIVTDEDNEELYVTYHSNASGNDEVDKPLSSIDLGTTRRFMLVEIHFPTRLYLPTIVR